MTNAPSYTGTIVPDAVPRWSALECAVGGHRLDEFMWMLELQLDGARTVHAYKHVMTRRYLYLADDGQAFGWLGDDRYCPIDLALVLPTVLGQVQDLSP